MKKLGFIISIISLALVSGCSIGSVMTDHFENVMVAVKHQDDPEIVRQSVPTMIVLLDAFLESYPDDPDLLRSAAQTYSAYAQAFVMPEGNEERAAILYGRAREYGLRLLSQYDFFEEAQKGTFEDFEKALQRFDKDDVPDIYAAGNAWLGWIISQPDSMEALDELPKALALMQRVLELDDSYADGGVHMVFGIYYAIRPPGAGRDLKKSLKHFQSAIKIAGAYNFLPQVLYAQYYLPVTGEKELFVKTLKNVLKKRKRSSAIKENALTNAIAKEQAKKLLYEAEDIF